MKDQLIRMVNAYGAARASGDELLLGLAVVALQNFLSVVELVPISNEPQPDSEPQSEESPQATQEPAAEDPCVEPALTRPRGCELAASPDPEEPGMDREWVDREQLEDAMRRAEANGAREGERRGAKRALDRIRNSPRTRREIGI